MLTDFRLSRAISNLSKKMKKLLAAIVLTSLAPSLWAIAYNDTITAIFGGGNPNTGWTSDSGNGITLALRAKNRTTGDTSNVNGVYSYADAPPTRGRWNYEFSINSGTATLAFYDYYLAVDQDSSQGISYSIVNPLLHWVDNSYGNVGTANGAGVEPIDLATYLGYPAIYTVAQNSQNITFGDYPGGALPLAADATYSYELFAVAKGAGTAGTRLAEVGITVVVGKGGAAVPETGSTLVMLGLGVAGLITFSLRRQALAA